MAGLAPSIYVDPYTGISTSNASVGSGISGYSNYYNPTAGTPQRAEAQLVDNNGNPIGVPAPAGGGGSSKPFDAAAAHNTQLAIDQLPAILQAALEAEGTKYGNTLHQFDAQQQQQQQQYDTSSTTNGQNYDANMMDSVRAGVRGLSGLIALLRGTGTEGWARDTVGNQTNQDIRTGLDTRNENQAQLDNTLSTFLTDLKGKRQEANDTHANNEASIRHDSNTQLQDLYSKMAGFYGDAGNTGAYNDWMGRAGSLTPDIAASSTSKVSNYDATPVAVKAPDITAFSAPTDQNTTSSKTDGQIGSGIFTIANRRKDPALAGA